MEWVVENVSNVNCTIQSIPELRIDLDKIGPGTDERRRFEDLFAVPRGQFRFRFSVKVKGGNYENQRWMLQILKDYFETKSDCQEILTYDTNDYSDYRSVYPSQFLTNQSRKVELVFGVVPMQRLYEAMLLECVTVIHIREIHQWEQQEYFPWSSEEEEEESKSSRKTPYTLCLYNLRITHANLMQIIEMAPGSCNTLFIHKPQKEFLSSVDLGYSLLKSSFRFLALHCLESKVLKYVLSQLVFVTNITGLKIAHAIVDEADINFIKQFSNNKTISFAFVRFNVPIDFDLYQQFAKGVEGLYLDHVVHPSNGIINIKGVDTLSYSSYLQEDDICDVLNLTRAKQLRHLRLFNIVHGVDKHMYGDLLSNLDLRTFCVGHIYHTQILSSLLLGVSNLDVLVIQKCMHNASDIMAIIDIVALRNPKLRYLYFDIGKNQTDEFITELLQKISESLPELVALEITHKKEYNSNLLLKQAQPVLYANPKLALILFEFAPNKHVTIYSMHNNSFALDLYKTYFLKRCNNILSFAKKFDDAVRYSHRRANRSPKPYASLPCTSTKRRKYEER